MTSIPNTENGTQTDTAPSLLESQSRPPTPSLPSQEFAAPAKRRFLSLSQVVAVTLATIWGPAGIYLIFASHSSDYEPVAVHAALGTIQTDIGARPEAPAHTQGESPLGSGLTTKELQMHQAATLLKVASQLANETRRNEIFSALAHKTPNLPNVATD